PPAAGPAPAPPARSALCPSRTRFFTVGCRLRTQAKRRSHRNRSAREGSPLPHDAPTAADATPPLELPPLARLLVEEGVFTTEPLRRAARGRDKRQVGRPLGDGARELQRVDEERIREVLKRRRQDVRLGDLLVELGYLRQESWRR